MKNYKPFAWAIGVVGVVASVMFYEATVAPTRVDDEVKRVEMEMMRIEMEKKRAEILKKSAKTMKKFSPKNTTQG